MSCNPNSLLGVNFMWFYLLVRFVLFVFSCGSKGFDGIVGPQGFPGPMGPKGIRVSRSCSPHVQHQLLMLISL